MASAVFEAAIKKVKDDYIVIQVTYIAGDGSIGLEPMLLMRILGEKLGYDNADLYDERKSESIIKAAFQSFEVLKTVKNYGEYKISLAAGTAKKFVGGESWQSYDYSNEKNYTRGVVLSQDGKTAITGVVPEAFVQGAAAKIEAVNKNGFGSIKAWLSHPDLFAVGCSDDYWWTAGQDFVRSWSLNGKKIEAEYSFDQKITAFYTSSQTLVGTASGRIYSLPNKTVFAELGAAVIHLNICGDYCAAVTTEKLFVGTISNGLTAVDIDLKKHIADLRVVLNNEGEWLATANTDCAWIGKGLQYKSHEEFRLKKILLANLHNFPSTYFNNILYSSIYNYGDIVALNCQSGELETLVVAPFTPNILLVSDNGNTIVTGAGYPKQQIAIFQNKELVLHNFGPYTNGISPSAAPVLSNDGTKLAIECAPQNHKDGYIAVFNTHTGMDTKLFNPRADYDFIRDIKFLSIDEVYVSYGNHPAVIWSLKTGEFVLYDAAADLDEKQIKSWQPDKKIYAPKTSLNGKWLLCNALDNQINRDVYDITPELYDLSEQKLVRSFPTRRDSYYNYHLWVDDNSTSWIMKSEKIVIYPPDNEPPRILNLPEPTSVTQRINSAYWKDGKAVWLLEGSGDNATIHPQYGVLKWKKYGYYAKYWS